MKDTVPGVQKEDLENLNIIESEIDKRDRAIIQQEISELARGHK